MGGDKSIRKIHKREVGWGVHLSKEEHAATVITAGYRLSQRRGRDQSADSGCQLTADPTRGATTAALPPSPLRPTTPTPPFRTESPPRAHDPHWVYIPVSLNFLYALRTTSSVNGIRPHGSCGFPLPLSIEWNRDILRDEMII